VEPQYRSYAAMFRSGVIANSAVTYLNISADQHIWPIIEAQGFSRYCDGIFTAVPMLSGLLSSGPPVEVYRASRNPKVDFDPYDQEVLLETVPIPWFRHGTVPSGLSSRNLLCAELVEGQCPKPGTRGHRFSEPASDNWRRVRTPSLWTDEVWDGSLATMLCEWLSKPETFQPLYTIFVQGSAGTRRAVLDHCDMEALVKRADFPAKRLAAA
jgi:hypothetical protein